MIKMDCVDCYNYKYLKFTLNYGDNDWVNECGLCEELAQEERKIKKEFMKSNTKITNFFKR